MATLGNDPRNFAEVRARLEEIVGEIRNKDLSLEKSLDLYEEAIRLGNLCSDLIDKADFSPEEAAEFEAARKDIDAVLEEVPSENVEESATAPASDDADGTAGASVDENVDSVIEVEEILVEPAEADGSQDVTEAFDAFTLSVDEFQGEDAYEEEDMLSDATEAFSGFDDENARP